MTDRGIAMIHNPIGRFHQHIGASRTAWLGRVRPSDDAEGCSVAAAEEKGSPS